MFQLSKVEEGLCTSHAWCVSTNNRRFTVLEVVMAMKDLKTKQNKILLNFILWRLRKLYWKWDLRCKVLTEESGYLSNILRQDSALTFPFTTLYWTTGCSVALVAFQGLSLPIHNVTVLSLLCQPHIRTKLHVAEYQNGSMEWHCLYLAICVFFKT